MCRDVSVPHTPLTPSPPAAAAEQQTTYVLTAIFSGNPRSRDPAPPSWGWVKRLRRFYDKAALSLLMVVYLIRSFCALGSILFFSV